MVVIVVVIIKGLLSNSMILLLCNSVLLRYVYQDMYIVQYV